ERQAALEQTRARQREQLQALEGDRRTHAQAVSQLDRRYRDRSSREQALGRDAKSLERLLARLRAAAARAEAERRAAAERAAREPAGSPGARRSPAPVAPRAAPIQVGGLGWPLSGTLLAGYGGRMP